ncbi:MAG: arylsulfatase [Puia sp.]|nr:arylsulfatase [Puia sp.]
MRKKNLFAYCLLTVVSGIFRGPSFSLCAQVTATGPVSSTAPGSTARAFPNIVFIYADDVGYGDLSCYGATRIRTPRIDRLAEGSIRFTNAHATAATCTPSRFSLMTGLYAWRKKGTGIAPGDASLIVDTARLSLPGLLKRAGYRTGVIGKWHLGLGGSGGPDWNGEIAPGPLEMGFDYSYIIPATLDRVPCVFVEDHRVVDGDPSDPISVSYKKPVGDWPTGRDHPELLRLHPSPGRGHDQTIVNGISRIGYMTGGKKALWTDQNIADTLTEKARAFIAGSREGGPFFLYLATTDIHVPRDPHPRFVGKSGMGPRGDAILQLDWTVGKVLDELDSLGLAGNTIVIFSSDNGPVLDDGYQDSAVLKLNGHRPAGPLRGGKYSAFDGGTRVPLLVQWKGQIRPRLSGALLSQVDFFASLADFTGQPLASGEAPDSYDVLPALLGHSSTGRKELVEQGGSLSLITPDWKYIEPGEGPAVFAGVDIESGYSGHAQLYDMRKDIGEKQDLSTRYPATVRKMQARLAEIRDSGASK